MQDNQEPMESRNHPNKAKRRQIQEANKPNTISVNVEVRFVYESDNCYEVKGQWFNVAEAINLPIYPNPEFTVVRIEFRDNKNGNGHA